jgi:MFS family permease
LVVKLSPADKKGTASGVYSSSQFLGAACGGALGGWFYQLYGMDGLFLFTAGMGLVWFAVAATMVKPLPLSIASVPFTGVLSEADRDAYTAKLLSYDGVHEVVFMPDDQRVYFKVDRTRIDEAGLIDYLEKGLA